MSFPATVYNVMIASPVDVQAERNSIREIVLAWNATHSFSRKVVLQPVGWETHSTPSMEENGQAIINKQLLDNADLLIAVFWTRLGTPTAHAESGTVEEIKRHIEAKKPAMIYFSSQPVQPDSVDPDQYRLLKEFKSWCMEKGLIEEYDNMGDFNKKLSRQLASELNNKAHFVQSNGDLPLAINELPASPGLTNEAEALLIEAAGDPRGIIMKLSFMGGFHIQTNGKQFVEQNNPRSRAAWEGALSDLEIAGLVEPRGSEGNVFGVRREGYEVAATLQNGHL